MTADNDIQPLLDRIVERTRQIVGVRAIALGGSRARATADPSSDIDLGLYYDPEQAFRIDELAKAARDLDDRHQDGLVTGFGEWGPGVNGGGWLIVEGHHVDFLYRDLRRVRDAIDRFCAGKIDAVYQIGHPMGFQNQIYVGETFHCRPLYDRDDALAPLKKLIERYPEPAREVLLRKHLLDAGFHLMIAGKPAARGDVFYVSGCLFRAIGYMTLVLYAVNRRYYVNEKGAIAEARSFPVLPNRFHTVVESTLATIGNTPAEMAESIARLEDLLAELTTLAQA